MGWERVRPTITELSTPPSLTGWLLAGLLTLIAGVLLFILHASGSVELLSAMNIWWLSLTPSGLWLLLFSLRGWLWGQELDEHQFQLKEAKYSQQEWDAWSGRHLAVLGSSVLLPRGMNADNILLENNALPPSNNLAQRITDVQPAEDALIEQSLAGVQKAVNALPTDLPIKVTLLTDSPACNALKPIFVAAWKTLFPARIVPEHISITGMQSVAWVASRIAEPVLTVDLLLVLQLHGHDDYSDGLASLLLTSDDVAQKYQLAHTSRLLRPMPVDMDNISDDLNLFLDTQTVASRTSRICRDVQGWGEMTTALFTLGAKKEALWQSDQVMTLERWTGIPGPAGAWLLMTLIADIVDRSGTSLLVMLTSESDRFITSVMPGNENG